MASILETIVVRKRQELARALQKSSREEIQSKAQQAPPPRDFVAAIRNAAGVALIAEVKKASPSKGVIREDFDPIRTAQIYQQHGATCISVLTDEHFFQGHLEYLSSIRDAVEIPLLRKDFILDEFQVYEARAAGADAVLLIAECLTQDELIRLHRCVEDCGMTALVELYNQANVNAVLACQPKLVGVNNRDLNTFDVDLQHSIRVKQHIPSDIAFVSESGIDSFTHVQMLADHGVDAILVGESLMRQPDIGIGVDRLMGRTGND